MLRLKIANGADEHFLILKYTPSIVKEVAITEVFCAE